MQQAGIRVFKKSFDNLNNFSCLHCDDLTNMFQRYAVITYPLKFYLKKGLEVTRTDNKERES